MLDRIIEDLMASFCSWRVDMGLMSPNRENARVTQPPTPPSSTTIRTSSVSNNSNLTSSNTHPKSSADDPEYFHRIMQNRYPEHMLHCPQTSLYPIFFFIMERWESRRAAAKQNVLPSATTSSDSQNE